MSSSEEIKELNSEEREENQEEKQEEKQEAAEAETEGSEKEETKSGKKVKKRVATWRIVVTLCMVFVVTFFLTGVIWALCTWSSISTDELLWHLHGSMDGVNTDMVVQFVLITVGSALVITGGAFFFNFKVRKNTVFRRRIFRLTQLLAALLLIATLISAWLGFGIGDYLRHQLNSSSYITENYVDPASVEITFPEKKRNVVIIYMESMEMTFADQEHGGAFPENVIPDLTKLAEEEGSENFSGNSGVLNGGIALPGAVWTMGALFGTSTGLPLKTPLGQNGMGANKDFFPGVITLGDILEKEGYTNHMLMGSDVNFGGCRKLYESHGNYEIHDYEYAKEVGWIYPNYKIWWGYEDEKLFKYAKEEIRELAASGEPFSYVIQTMDTHFEDGHSCPQCGSRFGSNKYANVMECSSRMVRKFVEWLKTTDFYENTTIIITGDHPTMDTDFCDDVPDDYRRKVYTCVINGAAEVKDPDKARVYTTFDLFPTMLAAMGVTIEGDRLGLGTNLYSDVPTLTEKNSVEYVEEQVDCRSPLMVDMFYGNYEHPKAKETE